MNRQLEYIITNDVWIQSETIDYCISESNGDEEIFYVFKRYIKFGVGIIEEFVGKLYGIGVYSETKYGD